MNPAPNKYKVKGEFDNMSKIGHGNSFGLSRDVIILESENHL